MIIVVVYLCCCIICILLCPVLSPEESTHASVNSYAAAMEEGELDVSDSVNTKDTPINPTYKVVTMPSRFSQKQGEGTIDIYWLYDDGGLSLLFPYLLSQDSKWSRSRLRIFTASSTRHIDSATLRCVWGRVLVCTWVCS